MRVWYARRLLLFYEKPRGPVLRFLGLAVISPLVTMTRRRVDSLNETLNNESLMLGRLELLANMLVRGR